MPPGRSLLDSLHFLEPAASADPEYRCLAGCQVTGPHTSVRWLSRKEISAAPCFPIAIKLGYKRMHSLGDFNQQ